VPTPLETNNPSSVDSKSIHLIRQATIGWKPGATSLRCARMRGGGRRRIRTDTYDDWQCAPSPIYRREPRRDLLSGESCHGLGGTYFGITAGLSLGGHEDRST